MGRENMNYHTHGKRINAKHGMEIIIIQIAANDCLLFWTVWMIKPKKQNKNKPQMCHNQFTIKSAVGVTNAAFENFSAFDISVLQKHWIIQITSMVDRCHRS